MKFYFYTAFSLLFYGLYRIYAPFCYPYLSRTLLLEKLKVMRIYYFTFKTINARKVNIYKKRLLCFLNYRLHTLNFLTTYQGKQLFHFTAADSYKSIVLFHIYLSYIFTRHSTFLI
mgnify:FL=1